MSNTKLIFQKGSSWLSSIILVLSTALPLNLGLCGDTDPYPAMYSWGMWQEGCCQVLQQHTLNSWVCTSHCSPVGKPTWAGFPVDPQAERGTYPSCSALSWSSHHLFLTFQPAENEDSTMVLPILSSAGTDTWIITCLSSVQADLMPAARVLQHSTPATAPFYTNN